MTELRIRRVDIADTLIQELLHVLHSEVFSPEDWTGNTVPKFRTGEWWIAFDGKDAIAFAGLKPSIRSQAVGYMCSAGVLPSHRGKGLQVRLIRKRVARAREHGWHTVITDTVNDNAASMRSLIKCGFRPYLPDVRWNASEGAVYWKRATEQDKA